MHEWLNVLGTVFCGLAGFFAGYWRGRNVERKEMSHD